MRVAIAAGGSGGHIIPALAVLDALRAREPSLEAAFFGPDDRGERALVEGTGLAFHPVPAAGLRGKGPFAMATGVLRLGKGIVLATRALRRYAPDAVFSTGGYGSFPSCVAARLIRRPLVIFLPDVEPGWAVRAEKHLASRLATTTEEALAHLPGKKTVATGYPVREAFFRDSRDAARARLGISPADSVLLVAGASQGALAINSALFATLPALLAKTHVFHITGRRGEAEATARSRDLGEPLKERYHPAPFRDDLPSLMLAADLAVMRAGASVLGELPAASLPAILIPGAFAGGHQRDNARWLAERGAAIVLDEVDLDQLGELCLTLLEDGERRATMRRAAAALCRRDAAAAVAAIIAEVAG